MDGEFIQIVKKHMTCYPLMEPQDYGKLIFQSEFGPEHLITDQQACAAMIQEELLAIRQDSSPQYPEPIARCLCRFPISVCKTLQGARLLSSFLIMTAKEVCGTKEGLFEKIRQVECLKFSGVTEWMEAWIKRGCPPVHHSEAYRTAYQPHYRLLKTEYAEYFPAVLVMKRLLASGKQVLVGIDGRCGSGKTRFAHLLGKLFGCNILHMDDFYLPPDKRPMDWTKVPGGNMDFTRLRMEALDPLCAKKEVIYRPYNCGQGHFGQPIQLEPHPLTVIEGSYSHHPLLEAAYDCKVFLTCSAKERVRRLRLREGSYFPMFEKQWMPMEENYLRAYSIEENSDFTIDTSSFFVS